MTALPSMQLPPRRTGPVMAMVVGGSPADATRDYRSPLWQAAATRAAAVWQLDVFEAAIRALPLPILHAIHGTERRLLDRFLAARTPVGGDAIPSGAGAAEALDWLGFASRIEAGLRVYATPSVIYRLRDDDGFVHFYCAPGRDAALAEHLSRLAPTGGMEATSSFLARPTARIEVEHPAGVFPGELTRNGSPATFADVAIERQRASGTTRSRFVTTLPASA